MTSRDSTYAPHRYYTKDDVQCSIYDMRGDSKATELKIALEGALSAHSLSSDTASITEKVLETLDRHRVFRYHNEGDVSLLATPGRVLVALMEDPTMTQRALSVYLDLSETMIDKTIKSLISKGLVTKTKLNRQNIYKINQDEVSRHPDIRRFSECISSSIQGNDNSQDNNRDKYENRVVEDAPF